MLQFFQVVGALLILVAFAAAQFGMVQRSAYNYLLTNLVGAVILGVVAYLDQDWGFFILEVAWFFVSAWGMSDRVRGRRPSHEA